MPFLFGFKHRHGIKNPQWRAYTGHIRSLFNKIMGCKWTKHNLDIPQVGFQMNWKQDFCGISAKPHRTGFGQTTSGWISATNSANSWPIHLEIHRVEESQKKVKGRWIWKCLVIFLKAYCMNICIVYRYEQTNSNMFHFSSFKSIYMYLRLATTNLVEYTTKC